MLTPFDFFRFANDRNRTHEKKMETVARCRQALFNFFRSYK